MPDWSHNLLEPFSELQFEHREDARTSHKRLEHRDWWSAITVMLLLTFAVIVVSLPSILRESDRAFRLNLSLAIHALVALVLLFNVYTIDQQWLIKRLRAQRRAAPRNAVAAAHSRGGIPSTGHV